MKTILGTNYLPLSVTSGILFTLGFALYKASKKQEVQQKRAAQMGGNRICSRCDIETDFNNMSNYSARIADYSLWVTNSAGDTVFSGSSYPRRNSRPQGKL